MIWTDNDIAELRALWAGGYSASCIAHSLKKSRNSILGKVHRLGLSKRKGIAASKEKQKLRSQRGNIKRREKRWAANPSLADRAKEKKEVRAMFQATGTSRTSRSYRMHMPRLPVMTKSELRSMLKAAVMNTAALS